MTITIKLIQSVKVENLSVNAIKVYGALANRPKRRLSALQISIITGLDSETINKELRRLLNLNLIGLRGSFGSWLIKSYKIRVRKGKLLEIPRINHNQA